jgi:hypothetical protein
VGGTRTVHLARGLCAASPVLSALLAVLLDRGGMVFSFFAKTLLFCSRKKAAKNYSRFAVSK